MAIDPDKVLRSIGQLSELVKVACELRYQAPAIMLVAWEPVDDEAPALPYMLYVHPDLAMGSAAGRVQAILDSLKNPDGTGQPAPSPIK